MYAIDSPSHSTPAEPDFVRRRVEQFYRDRLINTWKGDHICLGGRAPDPNGVLLLSNDYLSLAAHPKILKAQANALLDAGNGLVMSGIFLRGTTPHAALERRLAEFVQAEATVLCQSGWCANTGLIQSIADETTPVYIDMYAHVSLWEGIRSAGATGHPFRHNDVEHLESQIRRHGAGVVVVDSVYSTSGSVCPLTAMTEVAERHGCVIVVDESHSLGTHGERGEGLVASLGLASRVHFRTASLAKAFSARAGLITCSKTFDVYFRSTSRPAIFSSALLPHEIHGLAATLEVIETEDWRRQRLRRNASVLRDGLLSLGYNVGESRSQILGLEAGPEPATLALRNALESRGVFGAPFVAPATPANRSLVRFSVSAGLTDDQLVRVLEVCRDIREEVRLAEWPSTRRLQRRRPGLLHVQPEAAQRRDTQLLSAR